MTLGFKRGRSSRLVLTPIAETLEDRSVPATFGVPWGDAGHLSLSFVPDGTPIAGHVSNLFQTLDSRQATAAWQKVILQAFQTWAVQANINIGLKVDGGQAIGTPGKEQRDPRFGDVRITAQPMAADALAISVPGGSLMTGTWAGDLFLNSLVFREADAPDLFGVALHEAGHVFGQDNRVDPLSPMFPHLSGATSPTAADIASLQSLFGVRAQDIYEGSNGNDSIPQATSFPTPGSYNNDRPLVLFADRTTATDVDVFAVKASSGYSGAMTVRLQSAGLSLLAPHLVVMDNNGNVLSEAQADSGFGDTVTVHLPAVTPGRTYYLRVDSGAHDVFKIGTYGLAVTFDGANTVAPAILDKVLAGDYGTPNTTVVDAILRHVDPDFLNDDKHTDDKATEAATPQSTPGYAPNSHYDVVGSISDPTDTDFYRIRSVKNFSGPSGVMTVTVRSLDNGGAAPSVSIFAGEALTPVPVRILANGNGTYTIEAVGISANSWYFVRIPGDSTNAVTGNYEFLIDFPGKPTDLSIFAAGDFDASLSPQKFDLYVANSQLFDLLLSAGTTSSPTATVRMVVSNASNVVLYSLTATAGQTVSADNLFLTPGAYTVRFVAVGTDRPLGFVLSGQSISDPVGPSLIDPTLRPIYTVPGIPSIPPIFAYPGGVVSTNPFLLVAATNAVPDPGPGPGPSPPPTPDLGPPSSPPPLGVLGISAVGRSKKGLTSISVGFDTTLNLGSAGNLAFYKVLGGVKKHGKIVYTKSLRIRGVLFDSGAHTVTISLANPYKGALQVTIYPGIKSSAGSTSASVFSNIVR